MDEEQEVTMTVNGEIACFRVLAEVFCAMAPDSRRRAVDWLASRFCSPANMELCVRVGMPIREPEGSDIKAAIEARMPPNARGNRREDRVAGFASG